MTTILDGTATLAARHLHDDRHVFVDYQPGDATRYLLLIALGPKDSEVTVAWPGYGRAATIPRRELDSSYVAEKLFGGTANEVYEAERGVITDLLNAIIADLSDRET